MTLLEVKDLNVSFQTPDGVVRAVRGVSFDVEPGRTLGIVGESGSGKTVLTQTLLGLTPGAEVWGSAMFEGANLLELPDDELRKVRGARISVIFQDPLTSLHPLYKIGWQISEMIRAHDRSVSKKEAATRTVELLRRVGIPKPDTRVNDYPHQFSGGMRQRAMIAMALALEPKLIIADEPTTALDATVQAQILDLLLRLQQDMGTALIMITHDLGVVADIADDVMVMYAGRAAEKAPKREIFYHPHHPYTKGLLESIPSSSAAGGRLKPIPGQPPSLINLPAGLQVPPEMRLRVRQVQDRGRPGAPPGRRRRRARVGLLAAGRLGRPVGRGRGAPHGDGEARPRAAARPGSGRRQAPGPRQRRHRARLGCEQRGERCLMATANDADDNVLVRVENVVKYFPVKAGGFIKHTVGQVHAVDDVSLVIERGKTLGLVGETGSGKSTLARCVAGLIPVTSGKVFLNGTDISGLSRSAMRPLRREVQMIFQDPYSSLNPRRRVGAIIGDPFAIHKTATGAERKRMVQELMERVGLNPEHFNRFPAEFSGGQRQRIGVARALALRPKLIICDEPVSALDVSIQAQVLNLLSDLQAEYGLSYLFIAHDLEVVRHVSDKVAVMYLGRIGEAAPRRLALQPAAPPVHGRAAVGRPGRRPGRGRRPAADHPHRRRAVAHRPARRLPLPPALPQGAGDLRTGGATAGDPRRA